MSATTTSTTTRPATQGSRIEVRDLTKRFGSLVAVDALTFAVEPGRITGFLGPNGAGKTTTLRMLLGLVTPSAGTATIGGRRYHDLADPMGTVGAALEATNFHPGRSGRDHLRVLADAAGIPTRRVDEMLELTGIPAAARQRAGSYSMGMRQRLGLAAALLGDPDVLILDEPANGLDPEGIRWLRGLLRHLSDQGTTILVSSHMLQEVEQTVDDVVIIANGRLVKQGSMAELSGGGGVLVRAPDLDRLAGSLRIADVLSTPTRDGALVAETDDLRLVGDIAHRAGLPVWELTAKKPDLEELFFDLTAGINRNLGTPATGAVAAEAAAEPTEPATDPAVEPALDSRVEPPLLETVESVEPPRVEPPRVEQPGEAAPAPRERDAIASQEEANER